MGLSVYFSEVNLHVQIKSLSGSNYPKILNRNQTVIQSRGPIVATIFDSKIIKQLKWTNEKTYVSFIFFNPRQMRHFRDFIFKDYCFIKWDPLIVYNVLIYAKNLNRIRPRQALNFLPAYPHTKDHMALLSLVLIPLPIH